jgi:hypothetical protein
MTAGTRLERRRDIRGWPACRADDDSGADAFAKKSGGRRRHGRRCLAGRDDTERPRDGMRAERALEKAAGAGRTNPGPDDSEKVVS